MESSEPVRHVTIVGGGTAGWLTALTLNGRLNAVRRGPPIRISLIESPTVSIIGVGEGTLPGFVKELQSFDIDEAELARRCNVSFKYGVQFVDWNRAESGVPYSFIHPFGYGAPAGGKNPLNHFLAFGPHKGTDPRDVADSLDVISEAIRRKCGPRKLDPGTRDRDPAEQAVRQYGYHFDAVRLADFLKEKCLGRGVQHIVDDVDDVVLGEGNIITHLRLRAGGAMPVELVIDCTGFRGVLISKFLKEPFCPYSPHLLCDRAVALQIPHRDPAALDTCTRATALGAGWVWRVPLFSRIGTGYVFSSAFRTDDEAVQEFCAHLGVDPDKVEPRIIPMRVGRSRRAWVGNCIAVGLSGGFIEPLEATAIMSIQMAAFHIYRNFPSRSMPGALRERFNSTMNEFYDGIRDFILMHYYLGNRDERFWRAARTTEVLTDSLRENLDLWQHRLPYKEDIRGAIFTDMSYGVCLVAKGFYRGRRLPMESIVHPGQWRSYGEFLHRLKAGIGSLPTARDYLLRLRGETEQPRQAAENLAVA